MICVRLMGGLGNQMFQYAAGLRLATMRQTNLKLDLSFLLDRTPKENFTYRNFELEVFKVQCEVASESELKRFRLPAKSAKASPLRKIRDLFDRKTYYLEPSLHFNPRVLDLPDNSYLDGYFQDERYFVDVADSVRTAFTSLVNEARLPSPARKVAEALKESQSACLHVRRGDYAKLAALRQIYGLCEKDFYALALAELRARRNFEKVFVFSDDTAWCSHNFKEQDGFVVVGMADAESNPWLDLWVMTHSSYFIIGNSSYAWWAAWLSKAQDKMVCRPDPWFVHPELRSVEVCPESWLKISRS